MQKLNLKLIKNRRLKNCSMLCEDVRPKQFIFRRHDLIHAIIGTSFLGVGN